MKFLYIIALLIFAFSTELFAGGSMGSGAMTGSCVNSTSNGGSPALLDVDSNPAIVNAGSKTNGTTIITTE